MHKLRQEKDVLESKLKEFERSLQKLKDCTYQEATQKRDYERRLQALLADHRAVQADLRGASLREQVNNCPFDIDVCALQCNISPSRCNLYVVYLLPYLALQYGELVTCKFTLGADVHQARLNCDLHAVQDICPQICWKSAVAEALMVLLVHAKPDIF